MIEAREDAWDDEWENDWEGIYDTPWDDQFWSTKGRHLPLHVSLSPEVKGMVGEQIVAGILDQLPKDKYHVLNDVLLEIGNTSSQIDHIVVSRYGVFVIETKNYAGVVYGEEDDQRWLQIVGGKKNYFYNPLKQNERHVQVISRCVQNLGDVYIPVVVFSRNCHLQVDTAEPVIYADTLLPFINYFQREILSESEMQQIENAIKDSWNPSFEARMRHKNKWKFHRD